MCHKGLNDTILWILENQGVDLDEKTVAEATLTMKRTVSSKSDALDRVPFGTEPSSFLLVFHQFANMAHEDAR
jgi:hypothetical protein